MERQREPLPTSIGETPDLPAVYGAALDQGLERLGLDLSAEARSAIDGHVRLLLAWNRAINLTAIRDPSLVATGHVVDSLSAVAWLRARSPSAMLDLGSGGGFPGIPLAAALPDLRMTLVEATGKKARFLETVVAATGLDARVRVVAGRAEDLVRTHAAPASSAAGPGRPDGFPIVTARAVADLSELVELSFPLLGRGGSLVAWKRGDLAREIARARHAMEGLGGGTLDVHDPGVGEVDGLSGHRLVIATSTGAVPDGYPRDPGVRRRRPW